MKILSIGFGFVGKAYSIYLREAKHEVQVLTKEDNTKIDAKTYGFEQATANTEFDAAIIAVPTPTHGHSFDASIVEDAVNKAINDYGCKNVIIKSTVLPGTTKSLKEKNPQAEFYFYPEFLEAKNAIWGVFNQQITVFGNDNWTEKKKEFIKELFKVAEVNATNYETAEAIKYAHNLWLATNISFWNAMIYTSPKGVKFDFLLKEIHKSDYFGTHPWKIGSAFGGGCIPKDLGAYLGSISDKNEYKKFFQEIEKVNDKIAEETKNKN